jgi:ribose/xylose/arabinose/galactoside ABC-type transport system permease subunit
MLSSSLTTFRKWRARNGDMAALPFLLVGVVLILSVATEIVSEGNIHFLSVENFGAMAAQIPELGLLSLAMMVAMLTAGINLSIISSANLVGVAMAVTLLTFGPSAATAGLTVPLIAVTIVGGLLFSVLLGLFNGLLIAKLKITPVLATLGTMILYEGLTLAITKGYVISGMPVEYQLIAAGSLFGIPYALIVFVVAAIVMAYVLQRRPFGRQVYMLGSNQTATRFSAVNVDRVILKTYMLSGLLVGLAAVIMLSRFDSANARQGTSLLLVTVLIAVLGGTDPDGGFGKVLGLVLALLIMQCITSGLNLLGISSFLTLALWGGLLIGVIAYRSFRVKNPGKRPKSLAV